MSDCIFCQIAASRAPASIVYQDEHLMCFLDTQPVNPGHLLVVPRVHAPLMQDLAPALAAHMMQVAQSMMAGLRQSRIRCEGVNLYLSDGAAAGQDIAHVHLHVIPRFASDGFGLRFPPTYGNHPSRDDLDQLAADLRQAATD